MRVLTTKPTDAILGLLKCRFDICININKMEFSHWNAACLDVIMTDHSLTGLNIYLTKGLQRLIIIYYSFHKHLLIIFELNATTVPLVTLLSQQMFLSVFCFD